MSKITLETDTSRATPSPVPGKRTTVPAILARKADGVTAEPIVMLTAYTMRMAQLLDPHCDMLLVGDSLGQVIYGLPSTVPVTLEMMAAHGAAVVRGSYHAVVVIDMPFGSYEASPEKAFESAAFLLKQTGAAAVKLGRDLLALTDFPLEIAAHQGRERRIVHSQHHLHVDEQASEVEVGRSHVDHIVHDRELRVQFRSLVLVHLHTASKQSRIGVPRRGDRRIIIGSGRGDHSGRAPASDPSEPP